MSVILQNPPLVFVHIPKTAGTSIARSFRSAGFSPSSALLNGVRSLGHHPTAARIQAGLIEAGRADLYERAHVFAVVRHPFDRLVSFWYYGMERLHPCPFASFDHFIRYVVGQVDVACSRSWQRARHRQTDYLDARVDEVLRFENLGASWTRFVHRHGLPTRMQVLPKMKRTRHRPWFRVYTAEQAGLLYEYSRGEMDSFGYDLKQMASNLQPA